MLQQLQSRATAGREATAVLQEAQLLRAQHSAAQRGVEKAKVRLERVTEELERRHSAKRQAVEAPEWRSREYGAWPDDAAYWRQEESRVYARRRQNLSAVEEWTPPDGSSFIINATELRGVNFTMTPTTPPRLQQEVRRSGRRAAVVSTPPLPPPKEYRMDQIVDDDIRRRCW